MPKIIISSLIALTLVFIGGWDVQPTQARVKYIYVPITGQSQMFGAFGDPFLSLQVGSTPVNGYYLKTDGTNSTWAEVISSGGGSGSGTFSTTTTGGLLQYPYTTLTTSLDTNSTSTSKWWFNPELNRTVMTGRLGIGTTSPYAPLSVVGQVVASYFTATGTTASFFPLANITKLSNLTGNGFIKTSSSDGTLSVDTTTYESGLTAGDGLTRTGNDFDFDGGASPAGDLGGTWASPTVDDDSHAHTGATISGIDISDDTNLSGDTEIVLTGDALSIASTITRDTELSSYVPTSRQLTINGTAYDLSADRTWTISSGGTGNVATSSEETSGYVPYWSSTSATPATLGSDSGLQFNATADRLTVPYASTTAISGTTFCIGTDCRTSWPTGGGGGDWPFVTTDTNYGVAVQSTTTPEWFKNGMMASSTSYFANSSTTQSTVSNTAYFPGGGIWNSSGKAGVGTTTPFSNLSISNIGQQLGTLPLLTVASTTNATLFTVLGNGNVGIGTGAPGSSLFVSGTTTMSGGNLLLRPDNARYNMVLGGVSNYPGIWFGQSTPSLTNFTFLKDPDLNLSIVNAPSGGAVHFRVGNDVANQITVDSSKNLRVGGAYNDTSTTKLDVRGTGYFSGNVGLGTTSPYAKLSVVGEAVAKNFTATSTTATSTFTNVVVTGNFVSNRRVITLTDASTVTPNADITDMGILTTLSQDTLIATTTGNPADGQRLELRIKSTSSRALTWGFIYRSGADIILPTTTTGNSKTDRYTFEYNAVDSKWDIVGIVTGY